MWENITVFWTLNIYTFKEFLLNFNYLKFHNKLKYFSRLYSCKIPVTCKVSNLYITLFKTLKKTNSKSVGSVGDMYGAQGSAKKFLMFL
jgi:hypothetical protein